MNAPGRGIHIYPAPIVNESRIFKETQSLEKSGLFDAIDIVGHHQSPLPEIEEVSRGRRIVRIKAFGVDKIGLGLLGKALWFSAWMFRVVRRYWHADVTAVNAHSVAVLPLAWLIARLNRAKLIYDTHELETETVSNRGAQGHLVRILERLLVRRCDLVITVNQGIADWYAESYRVTPLVVRNIPDVTEPPDDVPDLHAHFEIPEHALLFIHTGNLGGGRYIPEILEAFSDVGVPHHVVFLGDGPMLGDVQEASSQCDRIHHLAPVPHDHVVAWVRRADIGLCLIESTSLSYRYALPNKFVECLIAGVPVVSTYLPEVHRMVGDKLLRFQITDVKRDLLDVIRAISMRDLAEYKSVSASLPEFSWPAESAAMLARYSELLETDLR